MANFRWASVGRLSPLRRFDPRLVADLTAQRRPILVGLVFTAVAALLAGSTIWLLKFGMGAIEKIAKYADPRLPGAATYQAQGLRALALACLLVVTVYGLRYSFVRGQTYYLSKAVNRLAAEMRVRLFRKLMRLPVGYFDESRTGAVQSVLTNDVNVYQNAIGLVRDSIDAPIKTAVAFVAIFTISWPLGLLALLLVPGMVAVIQRNARRMKAAQSQVQADLAEVLARTHETLQGARVVKAFGAEERMAGRYETAVEESFRSQMRAVAVVAALRPMVELIGAVGLALVLYIGGLLAARGILNVSNIVALSFALDTVNQGFRSMAAVSNNYAAVRAASARIYEHVLDVPEAHERVGERRLERPCGRIEFQRVSFRYPDGTLALRDVSFVLEPGRSMALVGPSGAGKTTIADLVLRFYDVAEGRILFDGVDVRELDAVWLRAQIGVVPQHTFLFAGSVEENVRLGAPEASDKEVRAALRAAHADEFVSELAARSTSLLGEQGVRLSGGQRQRVAIARALVRRPPVLLLDEATSALDAESERAVTEALQDAMRERTTLFIAHRLTTAARADQILVLSRGEIVEAGSHADLMAANGAYAGLFRAFAGGVLG